MFTDTTLSDTDRRAIHDFALDARDLLTTETRDLLEGVYGLQADGRLLPLSKLPNLANDLEGQETHARLGCFLEDEVKAGLERREAVDKMVKEVAYTHLNRLVAFKMMEARKLIRQTVSRGKDSNGFKFYLADHPDEEAMWKSGDAGANAAYQHFLLWQCARVAREIKVLFDPANLPSHLFPRSSALKELLDLLNDEALTPAWASAETIGWVYQYFNEREKIEIFERLYKKKQKIRREDIPAATQLYTPRWIVRFLVENTLGRMWVQMHPDSRLKGKLHYLVPLASEAASEPFRPVRSITLFEPACGTMHFGLVAFDLFAEMYCEELERAGQPGWPDQPSVASEAGIPAAIIANNLFGIDIDLRAVQLSALTLYLKAKELNKDAVISSSNLTCADILALNGERLDAFIKEMNIQKPSYERLIRALWVRLKDINQLGSLLRLEEEIETIVQEEHERYDREGRQPDLFGERARFESEAAHEEYWSIVQAQLIQAFNEFARRAAQRGLDETFFAGEGTKGLRLLDLMLRRYDCVVTNPPYMGRRNMNATLADFLDEAYSTTKGDLYTAFIARCIEFVKERGRLGMITQQSFMFLSSYEQLREDLLQRFAIETMAHTGPGAFAEIGGEKVNTTVFAMSAEPDAIKRDNAVGTYFRLVNEVDKQAAFERSLAALRDQRNKRPVTLGILAYGSLLANPGREIDEATADIIRDVETPFAVEYARRSENRAGAPTLVPVSEIQGKRVTASIFVLKPDVIESQAKDILYRRELNQVGSQRRYNEPGELTANTITIKELKSFRGFTSVLYTSIGATIPEVLDSTRSQEEKAELLAHLAIASVTVETFQQQRDGICYLADAIKHGIETQLTDAYRQAILGLTGDAPDLEEARVRVAQQKGILP
jgi:hypothetical protein